jgi:hypothetical protein
MGTEARLGVVWKRAHLRCEYWICGDFRGGILRLFAADTMIIEHPVPHIDEMLRVAARWKELHSTLTDQRASLPEAWRQAIDRRVGKPERRRNPRGGRRREERDSTLWMSLRDVGSN